MLGPLETSSGPMTLCVVRDGSERRRLEDALRASEARFRTLVEQATDGIFISTADGRYLDVNAAGCQMVGYSRDEIVRMTIAHLIPADEVPRIAPEIAHLQGGQPVKREWRFRRKDGSIFVGEVNVRQLPDSRLLAILRDISARKAALRNSEARLAEAQQLAGIGSWELDLATDELIWSEQTYRIFETEPSEFGGGYDDFLRRVHPDDRARVNDAYARSLSSRLPYEIEHRIVMKDGRIRHVTERCMTHYDADGKALRSNGTVQDITERRRMQQALRASQARLSGIVESAFDAIVTIDGRQRVVVFNRAAERMFGIDATAVIGGPLDRLVAPRVRAHHHALVQRFATTGDGPRRMGTALELTAVRADGAEFPIEASIAHHDDGERLLMTAMIRDVTEQRRAEQAGRAQASAEAASRAKTEFLARMSHEMRTPLNAVLGFSQLLLMQAKDRLSEQQAKWTHNIVEAGRHLTRLIDDLLDISRIELGELAVETVAVDLQPLLDEAVLMMHAQAERAQVSVSTDYRAAAPLQVLADPTRLRQVVLNLLSNAIKYNREGGSVHVRVAPTDDCVRIEVADTGLGMTHEQIDRLFVPFDRLGREKSRIEGVGIGLALSRRLVLLMQGTIDVQSEPGRGTSIRIGRRRCSDPSIAGSRARRRAWRPQATAPRGSCGSA
jgi:PAS domain S-box-containing protein